tara:strand:+ start:848 stop:1102 length:255 start_codon:yes stop_codon:yes gene_type:complete
MISFLEEIKIKLNNKFNPSELSLVDNSHLHIKHKSFNPEKIHLKIIIKSIELKKMKKLDAHKAIYSLLAEDMKKRIHALEIEIK